MAAHGEGVGAAPGFHTAAVMAMIAAANAANERALPGGEGREQRSDAEVAAAAAAAADRMTEVKLLLAGLSQPVIDVLQHVEGAAAGLPRAMQLAVHAAAAAGTGAEAQQACRAVGFMGECPVC